jgi:hypothetical protein
VRMVTDESGRARNQQAQDNRERQKLHHDQTESPRLLNLNFQMVGGGNENGHGQQYGFPVAVVGRDVQHGEYLHALRSYGDIARGIGEMLGK